MGCKRRATAASHLDEELEESCPSGSHQGLQPARGATAGVEAAAPPQDTQVSAHRKSILAKVKQLIAKACPRIADPVHLQMQLLPQLPDPAGAAGRESFWAAPALAPPPSSQALAGLQHRTRLHLRHQGWAFPPSPPSRPAQRLGWSPGLASLPAATPGWQCPCWQQPSPWPCQHHPTAKAHQPHIVPSAPPTLRLRTTGLDPARHMAERVETVATE